jgi:hypothetical protein
MLRQTTVAWVMKYGRRSKEAWSDTVRGSVSADSRCAAVLRFDGAVSICRRGGDSRRVIHSVGPSFVMRSGRSLPLRPIADHHGPPPLTPFVPADHPRGVYSSSPGPRAAPCPACRWKTVHKPLQIFRGRSCCSRDEAGSHHRRPKNDTRQDSWICTRASLGHASQRLEKPQARRASACLRLRPAIFIPLKQPVFSALRGTRFVAVRWVREDPSIHESVARGDPLPWRRLFTEHARNGKEVPNSRSESRGVRNTSISNALRRRGAPVGVGDSADHARKGSRQDITDEARAGLAHTESPKQGASE